MNQEFLSIQDSLSSIKAIEGSPWDKLTIKINTDYKSIINSWIKWKHISPYCEWSNELNEKGKLFLTAECQLINVEGQHKEKLPQCLS